MASPAFWILISMPLIGLLGRIYYWRWQIAKRQERVPTAIPLLRPPGESLRTKVEALDEKLSDNLLGAVAIPAALAMSRVLAPANYGVDFLFVLFGLLFLAFFAPRILRIARELRACRLGFHGERAAGEELNQLMLRGCRVFHDVPMPPYGNIDHVIVAPTGVYAVETKTRRMRKVDGRRNDHVVTYDGHSLEFPFGRDTTALVQAQQQADRLRTLLSSAVAEAVRVIPILALPGWYVKRISNRGVPVLNPKSVRHVVLDRKKRVLDQQLLDRVVHQLDRQCRDVTL
jgi:hypothetical protein